MNINKLFTSPLRMRESCALVIDIHYGGRWEFSGNIAMDIRDEYIGFSVGKAGQNPIRYVNI
jgi:hypothetical protein